MTQRPPGDIGPTENGDIASVAISLLESLRESGIPPTTIDEATSLLTNRRRRLTLAVVRDHDEPITLPDVADEVAVRENDRPLPDLEPETVACVYTSIYHDHLPRLVDAGLLVYDQKRDLVSPAY